MDEQQTSSGAVYVVGYVSPTGDVMTVGRARRDKWDAQQDSYALIEKKPKIPWVIVHVLDDAGLVLAAAATDKQEK